MKACVFAVVTATVLAVAIQSWRVGRDSPTVAASAPRADMPAVEPSQGYVGSLACRECHDAQYTAWQNSFHRTMTQAASPESVRGDFNDVQLSWHNAKCRLTREGDRFWVEFPQDSASDAKSNAARHEIVLCTGSHHMQVYWYPTGQSRVLAQLPFVYLIESQRWAPRTAAFLRPPERTPSSETGRWNHVCIKCHTTGAQPGIEGHGRMEAHVADFGIACEACHGPGAAHATDATATMVNPAKLSHRRSAEVCGQCHSVSEFISAEVRDDWELHGFRFRPGDDLSTERVLIEGTPEAVRRRNLEYLHLVAGGFWSDGMVRIAGREFNALSNSACFQRGEMTCLSCHQMHQTADDPRPAAEWADDQLAPGMDGNQACVECHQQFADSDAVVQHTHHLAASSGNVCYNCHMPHTSYGLMKATRSHQISSPSVAASVTTGRPNACNQCHLDKTLQWTANRLDQWYGITPPPLNADQRTYAASVLWALRGDAGQRALMAWSFGWEPAQQASGVDWMAPLVAELMNDPYDAVRHIATRSLHSMENFQQFPFDFLAPQEDRLAAIDELLKRWSAPGAGASARRISKAVLLDVNGNVRRDEFNRLLSERDHRPVTLVE